MRVRVYINNLKGELGGIAVGVCFGIWVAALTGMLEEVLMMLERRLER